MSGHARTYDKTYQFWQEHLLSKYDVDIHLHLWDTIGPRSFGPGRREDAPLPRGDFESGILPSASVNQNNHLWDMWKPTTLTIQMYDQYHTTFVNDITPILDERNRRGIAAGFEHHHPLSVRSMLFKRWKCNKVLARYDVMYDMVIQTRMDIAPARPMEIDVTDTLQFHNCRSVTAEPEIADFAAIGSPSAMNVWCNLYEEQLNLFERVKTEDNFFTFLNPHKMYVRYLTEQQQPYVETDLGLCIVRDNGHLLGWPHDKRRILEKLK
jgi:hypothetical protein